MHILLTYTKVGVCGNKGEQGWRFNWFLMRMRTLFDDFNDFSILEYHIKRVNNLCQILSITEGKPVYTTEDDGIYSTISPIRKEKSIKMRFL